MALLRPREVKALAVDGVEKQRQAAAGDVPRWTRWRRWEGEKGYPPHIRGLVSTCMRRGEEVIAYLGDGQAARTCGIRHDPADPPRADPDDPRLRGDLLMARKAGLDRKS